ncbi:hypothetical protein EB796_013981 [Bugula neritina]|uniref:Alpha-2-macroglobulin bait region domain-containing protein n=1 Tax=Bugula neritina TaxID=10212 RepID=A0A7J7JQI0_BUGNE|nr:hypothetical protein EB796_013981 [Bugula neritina]
MYKFHFNSEIQRWSWLPTPTRTDYVTVSVTFPKDGLAQFKLDVPSGTTSITLDAKYDGKDSVQATKTITETKSKTNNFIQLLLLTNQLQAGSLATFKMSSTVPNQVIDYQIWSRGSMVVSGSVTVNSQSSFSVQMLPIMAPSARIVAYYVTSGSNPELVADSLNFNVEGAFDKNQVQVSYSKSKAAPGESVDVEVTAASGSLVGLLAVDQSVLLLAGGNDITQDDVLSELRSYDTTTQSTSYPQFRFFWYPYSVSGTDTSSILSNSGLVALTNTLVYKHVDPIIRPPIWNMAMARGGFGGVRPGIAVPEMAIASVADSIGPVAPAPNSASSSLLRKWLYERFFQKVGCGQT